MMDANLVMPFAGAMDYPPRTRKNGTRLPSTPSSNNNTGSLSHSATIKNSLLARGLEMVRDWKFLEPSYRASITAVTLETVLI